MRPISQPDASGSRWYWSSDLRRPVLLAADGAILQLGGLDNPPASSATLQKTQLNQGRDMDTLFAPLIRSAIGSFLRTLLVGLGGYLVSTGVWSPENADKYIEGIVLALVGLIWSLYQKYRQQQTIQAALETPAGTSRTKFDQLQKTK